MKKPGLPRDWESMSLNSLYWALNDRRRFAKPESRQPPRATTCQVALPDATARRVPPSELTRLVEDASSVRGKRGEQLRAIWQAIVTADHPVDREIIAKQLADRATRDGLHRACQHLDGNDLDHVVSWGIRGWLPFGTSN